MRKYYMPAVVRDAAKAPVAGAPVTAINQVTYAFGPGVIGLLRDASGSYSLPFYGCIALELVAAALIMIRGRPRCRHPA